MALGSTQTPTEMSTRSISWGSRRSVCKADNLPTSCTVVKKSGSLNFLEPSGPVKACNGTDLPLPLPSHITFTFTIPYYLYLYHRILPLPLPSHITRVSSHLSSISTNYFYFCSTFFPCLPFPSKSSSTSIILVHIYLLYPRLREV